MEYSAQDQNSGLSEARLVIHKDDSNRRVIIDRAMDKVFTWDGWFSNGVKAGASEYDAFLKVTDMAGNETVINSTVTVEFSIASLLPAIPLFADENEEILPTQESNEDELTFGDEISNDSSTESSTIVTGGEVQLSATTNGFSTGFGGNINNTMLAILAAAALEQRWQRGRGRKSRMENSRRNQKNNEASGMVATVGASRRSRRISHHGMRAHMLILRWQI